MDNRNRFGTRSEVRVIAKALPRENERFVRAAALAGAAVATYFVSLLFMF
jgi:hypothetical protein